MTPFRRVVRERKNKRFVLVVESGDSAHTVQMTVQKTSKSMMGIEAWKV